MLGLSSQFQSSQGLLPFLSAPHFSRQDVSGCPSWIMHLPWPLCISSAETSGQGELLDVTQVTLGQLWMLCERNPLLNGLQTHSWHNLSEIRGAVQKFLLSSCELLALPSLGSVSEHISTGRMSWERNKVLGRKGSQLSGMGRLRFFFFSSWSFIWTTQITKWGC